MCYALRGCKQNHQTTSPYCFAQRLGVFSESSQDLLAGKRGSKMGSTDETRKVWKAAAKAMLGRIASSAIGHLIADWARKSWPSARDKLHDFIHYIRDGLGNI